MWVARNGGSGEVIVPLSVRSGSRLRETSMSEGAFGRSLSASFFIYMAERIFLEALIPIDTNCSDMHASSKLAFLHGKCQ